MISAMSLSAAALHLRAGGLKIDTIRDDNIKMRLKVGSQLNLSHGIKKNKRYGL